MKAILGQKVGMTQVWDDKGRLVPATVILAEPNKVLENKENTVLVGVKTAGKTAKAQRHFATKLDSKRGIRIKSFKDVSPEGETLSVSQFKVGENVSITGTTKGKGFAGVVKRHGFAGWPASHGHSHQRRPGSIGAQRPQRVVKGQKMGGHMGHETLTVRGNKVISIDTTENLLIVSGAVPGPAKGHLVIRSFND
ncbi:MAG: 50S ribosomal protein L3 [Candidatus Berkelbacteria bacterium]|nr:MAG: 50S ribosomal protein L3 [Candidatus Berkelbacteria bacterium]QQG52092.1 MAG: 50S ribosomal protein L3 [Candidatus Berkelbacteria bacterium]